MAEPAAKMLKTESAEDTKASEITSMAMLAEHVIKFMQQHRGPQEALEVVLTCRCHYPTWRGAKSNCFFCYTFSTRSLRAWACLGDVPTTLTLTLLKNYRDKNGRRILIQIGGLVVSILLSAKKRAYFDKSIAIEMGGVSRYFSEVSGSWVIGTPLLVSCVLTQVLDAYADGAGTLHTHLEAIAPRRADTHYTAAKDCPKMQHGDRTYVHISDLGYQKACGAKRPKLAPAEKLVRHICKDGFVTISEPLFAYSILPGAQHFELCWLKGSLP